jgi:hypothetical protein
MLKYGSRYALSLMKIQVVQASDGQNIYCSWKQGKAAQKKVRDPDKIIQFKDLNGSIAVRHFSSN